MAMSAQPIAKQLETFITSHVIITVRLAIRYQEYQPRPAKAMDSGTARKSQRAN